MELTDEERKVIEKLRKDNAIKDWKPRPIGSYTVTEKAAAFDELYELARRHFHRSKQEEYQAQDFRQYAKVAVIELLGEGVREALDRFPEG